MEPAVARIYRPEQLARATEAWGIEARSARVLGDFENYVYEVAYRGRPAILRLTHSSHRTPELVRAELGWIEHLGRGGVDVCPAIASEGGDLLEVVPASEGVFTAVLFERAGGQRARRADPTVWNPTLFAAWGAAIGRMHHLAKGYAPAGVVRRPAWDEDDLIVAARSHLPAGELWVADRMDEMVESLRSLGRDRDGYGMIHGDVHHGNFFVDGGGRIVIFDFDDAGYHWFGYDIAVSLYHVFPWTGWEPGWEGFAAGFLAAFFDGYRRENRISAEWVVWIPEFLRLRDLTMYVNFCKKRDLQALSAEHTRFREDVRARIEERRALVDVSTVRAVI